MDLSRVELLRLSYNRIKMIESGAFASLKNLKNIGLNDNQISVLPEGLFRINKKLEKINLSDNLLKCIPKNIFNHHYAVQINLKFNCCLDKKIGHTSSENKSCSNVVLENSHETHFVDNILFRLFFGDWRFLS
jgi:Leucine-rich repeat (LRR) protein